ncbi:MAG: hypothetical protein ACJ8GK_03870 [Luteimonas sp.]
MSTHTYAAFHGNRAVPSSDLARFAALDCVELRSTLPGDCDPGRLVQEGLIEPATLPGTWRLTVQGRLALANLRSMERQRQKG